MIKITGGSFKGRSIGSNSGLTTRPTASKVREALFNIISNDVMNSRWLDLFGGTGVISIEAISRDADKAVLTEIDNQAFTLLKKNFVSLDIKDKAEIVRLDAVKFLSKCTDSFDFIFLDPPYASDLYNKTFSIIDSKPAILNPEGTLIVEHPSKLSLPNLDSFSHKKSYKYGDTTLSLFKHKERE